MSCFDPVIFHAFLFHDVESLSPSSVCLCVVSTEGLRPSWLEGGEQRFRYGSLQASRIKVRSTSVRVWMWLVGCMWVGMYVAGCVAVWVCVYNVSLNTLTVLTATIKLRTCGPDGSGSRGRVWPWEQKVMHLGGLWRLLSHSQGW